MAHKGLVESDLLNVGWVLVYWFVGLPFGCELPIPTSLPEHPDQLIDVEDSGAAAPDLLVLGLVVVACLFAPCAPNVF